jgi:hypothetical protein
VLLQGDEAALSVRVERHWRELTGPLQITGMDLPPQFLVNNNQPLTMGTDMDHTTLRLVTTPKSAPGSYTIVLRSMTRVPFSRDAAAKATPITVVLPSTPVTLTVLPKHVAQLSVAPASAQARSGTQVVVNVKISRLYNFTGEYAVSLTAPPGVTGIHADNVIVPRGGNEARLLIQLDRDVPPAHRFELAVRVTAQLDAGMKSSEEAKLALSVAE